jgi:hypothetical protein
MQPPPFAPPRGGVAAAADLVQRRRGRIPRPTERWRSHREPARRRNRLQSPRRANGPGIDGVRSGECARPGAATPRSLAARRSDLRDRRDDPRQAERSCRTRSSRRVRLYPTRHTAYMGGGRRPHRTNAHPRSPSGARAVLRQHGQRWRGQAEDAFDRFGGDDLTVVGAPLAVTHPE